MTSYSQKTFCTICTAFCGFEARVEDGAVVDMVPDTDHPMSRGFSCIKGRQFHHLLNAGNRLIHPMARVGGELVEADYAAVLDEAAARLDAVRREHGPESIAVYCGNGVTFKTAPLTAVHAFMRGLGSHHIYSSLTIDQPAKITAVGRVGLWGGGVHDFESSNVAVLIGNNVVVSGLHVPGGAPGYRPSAIKEAKKRGLKLIVVDPRRTATANLADLHLQIRPGEDAALLAGMFNLILDQNRFDAAFCDEFVSGASELRSALAPFTLDCVTRRTGLSAADIEAAVHMFTSAGRGTISSATGPDMGPHGNLTEHLIYAINIVCGRFNRAGEVNEHLSMLMPDLPSVAAVVPRAFIPPKLNPECNTKRARLSGASQLFHEMPTSTLADEILTPGAGQIRALIVAGGSPLTSWPDRDKTRRALQSLDTLICMDVRPTDTVALADFFLPGSYGLERPELNGFNDFLYNKPFVQFADPVVNAPGEAREEWIYFAELARRLATPMRIGEQDLDLDQLPSSVEFLAMLYPPGSTRVPLRDIMSHQGGKVYEEFADREILPKFDGMDDRFLLFAEGVAEEIADLVEYEVGAEGRFGAQEAFTHLMICRRTGNVYNSMCHELPKTANGNPAYLHPTDIEKLGAAVGQTMRLVSAHGSIEVQIAQDSGLRPGVVSISHGFGSRVGGEDNAHYGAVADLLSTDYTLDRVTRMPIMSAVPVRFERADA